MTLLKIVELLRVLSCHDPGPGPIRAITEAAQYGNVGGNVGSLSVFTMMRGGGRTGTRDNYSGFKASSEAQAG